MNRFFKGVGAFLPHLIIAMSVTLLTLSITDHYNTAMAFINHPMTKLLLLIYGLLSLAVCVMMIVYSMEHGLQKALLPLICTVASAVLLTALFYDQLYPRDILFVRDFGKTLIFVNTMVSLVNAAYTAKVRRNAAMRSYRKSIESNQERT